MKTSDFSGHRNAFQTVSASGSFLAAPLDILSRNSGVDRSGYFHRYGRRGTAERSD